MIQRVQTLFLLIATIASVLMIVIPFYQMIGPNDDVLKLYYTGLENVTRGEVIYRTLPLAVITVVTGLISFITILLFQRRTLQMRLCVYNILLIIAQFGLILFYYFSLKNKFDAGLTSFSFTAILPLVNIVLIFQAFRAIRRDDLLIKSYDRLR